MKINVDGFKELKTDDHFHFVSSCCGGCCQNVKYTVSLASDEQNEDIASSSSCSINDNQYMDLFKKFTVTIIETLEMTVDIEAEDQHDAEQMVSDKWKNSEYILGSENFSGVRFEANSITNKE